MNSPIPAKKYKKCTELKDITPQIIREWTRETSSNEIMLVKRQTFFCCPLTNTLIPEAVCLNCAHNYGAASTREIYCMPNVEKTKSARVRRRV